MHVAQREAFHIYADAVLSDAVLQALPADVQFQGGTGDIAVVFPQDAADGGSLSTVDF